MRFLPDENLTIELETVSQKSLEINSVNKVKNFFVSNRRGIRDKMNTFDTLDNRCRVCALELSDLTCSIPIFGDSSASYFLQTKISKYLYITVRKDKFGAIVSCFYCFYM